MSGSSTKRKGIAAMDRDNDGSTISSSGPGSDDLSDLEKRRAYNIRRNELFLSNLGFVPADNRRSSSSSGSGSGDVQRRFCFLFFEFELILILNLMV
jgi:hypothetical protein